MKHTFLIFLIASISIFPNCGENKSTTNEQAKESNSTTENKKAETTSTATSGDGIVGTWKLHLEVYDDNGNRIPDEAEMQKGTYNSYRFQFNADGSCRIQTMLTGRYERKTENGLDKLYVYRKKIEGEEENDPPPDVYLITSLNKDELVLRFFKAEIFWFFKRI